jgi:hypothetical protein
MGFVNGGHFAVPSPAISLPSPEIAIKTAPLFDKSVWFSPGDRSIYSEFYCLAPRRSFFYRSRVPYLFYSVETLRSHVPDSFV